MLTLYPDARHGEEICCLRSGTVGGANKKHAFVDTFHKADKEKKKNTTKKRDSTADKKQIVRCCDLTVPTNTPKSGPQQHVPRSATIERRLPAAIRQQRSATSEVPRSGGLQRRQGPRPSSVSPRLPQPWPPGLVPSLPATQKIPIPRPGWPPRRRILGRRSAERSEWSRL